MKKYTFKTYALWIIFTEIIGAVSGFLTRQGMEIYKTSITKPPLTPPSIVFPIVWTILFALMGLSAARIYTAPKSCNRSRGLTLFFVQLIFNFFWSFIFFNFQKFGFAFIWLIALWILILSMAVSFSKTDKTAALLQIPYLIWVAYAGYLNFGVWQLN